MRSRGLALNLTVFFGCMAGGSVTWGFAAGELGLAAALLLAAGGACLGAAATRGWRLQGCDAALDLAPSHHWPEPVVAGGSDA